MAIRDRRTLSLGQGGTKAKKADVEQTSELVGRRRGEAERVSHAEKTTCNSHRKTSKASSRTTRKVRFHLRIMEIKEASKKKIWGNIHWFPLRGRMMVQGLRGEICSI